MSDIKEITLNRLPSITWNWLRMNGTVIRDLNPGARGAFKISSPGEVSVKNGAEYINGDIDTGCGKEFSEFLQNFDEVHTEIVNIPENLKTETPVTVTLDYSGEKDSVNSFFIKAEKNSDITVIMDMNSPADLKENAALQTVFDIEDGARVHFIQVQKLGPNTDIINDAGARLGENASLDVIQLVLGGKNTYMGLKADLSGNGSSFSCDIGYITGRDEKLDINYIADHKGKKTNTEITASGVLRENAEKLFRGTIDFKNGSAGSEGHENENVLLMDEDVHNKTIPVILCAEEDVVGTHGASIGRVDEGLMFYLESRGLSHDQVYEMMARARIDAVVNKVQNPEVRKEIEEFLYGPGDDFE